MPSKTSIIDSLEALQREQFMVRERLKTREGALRNKMHEIPGELAAAGANSFIPKILRGKVSNAALNGGKSLINWYFSPKDQPAKNLLTGAVKKSSGLLSGVKTIFKMLRKK